jgi:hypothetical protein
VPGGGGNSKGRGSPKGPSALNLSYSKLNDASLEAMLRQLSAPRTCKVHLSLCGNNLSPEMARAFQSLERNSPPGHTLVDVQMEGELCPMAELERFYTQLCREQAPTVPIATNGCQWKKKVPWP